MLRCVICVSGFSKGLYFIWAAWNPNAAQIGIAIMLNEINIQGIYGVDVIIVISIRVPASWIPITMAVEEYDGGSEIIIMVDYICEVGHGFSAFIYFCVDGSILIINSVDDILPTRIAHFC